MDNFSLALAIGVFVCLLIVTFSIHPALGIAFILGSVFYVINY